MTDKPAILLIDRHLAPLMAVLDSDYTVYRLWEGPPLEASAVIRAVVVRGADPLEPALLDSLPALGLVACFTVGYEAIDLDEIRRRGLRMSYAAGTNHEDVADHALALMLAARREIVSGDRRIRAGQWQMASRLLNRSMSGQRVGIVGLGHIGLALAKRCEALAMPVTWWGPRPKPDEARPRAAGLVELARDSDILAVCAQLDDTTRGMIDRAVIEALGPAGLLVNVARGALVDEGAVIAALKDGRLGAAALDVFEPEPTPAQRWADMPNVVLTPHTAGATDHSVAAMVASLRDNLARYFAGQPLKSPAPL